MFSCLKQGEELFHLIFAEPGPWISWYLYINLYFESYRLGSIYYSSVISKLEHAQHCWENTVSEKECQPLEFKNLSFKLSRILFLEINCCRCKKCDILGPKLLFAKGDDRDLLRGIGQPTMERGSWRIEFVNMWERTELPTNSPTSHNNTLQNQLFVDKLGMKASLPCSCWACPIPLSKSLLLTPWHSPLIQQYSKRWRHSSCVLTVLWRAALCTWYQLWKWLSSFRWLVWFWKYLYSNDL